MNLVAIRKCTAVEHRDYQDGERDLCEGSLNAAT